jgi:divalent metal cation (Fe/Co/Zn/Cd) transporter
MAGHGHQHGPGGDHDLRSGRDVFSTVVLLVLSAVDYTLGWALVNPALIAEAGHNAFDALYTLMTAALKLLTRNSNSHWLRKHLPAQVGVTLCVATVVVTGVLIVREAFMSPIVGSGAAVITALAGLAGSAINFGLSRLMARGSSDYDQTNAAHFRTDAKLSLIVAACGIVAGVFQAVPYVPRGAYVVGALALLLWIALDNYHVSREMALKLRDCLRQDRLS